MSRYRQYPPSAESRTGTGHSHGQVTPAVVTGRPAPLFVAEAPGLDFLNTLAVPGDEVVDWIGSGEDLLTWLDQAGLLPHDELENLRAHARPGELDAVAEQARALRKWFRGFVDKHRGAPLPSSALADLEPLNSVLARDESYGRIVACPQGQTPSGRSGLACQFERRWRSPDTLLQPIAWALAKLVCEDDFTRIKGCEGADCILYFIDRSRSGSRRWCSMAICGNRAKQSALRARQREDRNQAEH